MLVWVDLSRLKAHCHMKLLEMLTHRTTADFRKQRPTQEVCQRLATLTSAPGFWVIIPLRPATQSETDVAS